MELGFNISAGVIFIFFAIIWTNEGIKNVITKAILYIMAAWDLVIIVKELTSL